MQAVLWEGEEALSEAQALGCCDHLLQSFWSLPEARVEYPVPEVLLCDVGAGQGAPAASGCCFL